MELIINFFDIVLHLDIHLNMWVLNLGPWIYLLLFMILFCETGLVITPFLPGDSLLFALGALAASENAYLNINWLAILLISAAIIGDAVNYSIGKIAGPKIFYAKNSRWLNKEHLIRTQNFYEKHGGKTIILARFIPIIRTFAPFVAGIGKMQYRKFFIFNIVGAILWVVLFLAAGYYFGNLPSVKNNFHIVIFAIIIISFLPVLIEFLKSQAEKKSSILAD